MTFERIKNYLEFRGAVMPTAFEALLFATTEFGELCEALLKAKVLAPTNQSTELTLAPVRYEFGDVYQMLQISCYNYTGRMLEDLANDYTSEGLSLDQLKQYSSTKYNSEMLAMLSCKFAALIDDHTRDNPKWVRNNPGTVSKRPLHFVQLFLLLEAWSHELTRLPMQIHMLEKWASKHWVE